MAHAIMHLHRAGPSYIGQLVTSEAMRKTSEILQPPQRVLVMDNSGSMGQWSKRILHCVFPQMLDLMGAQSDDPLLVILFSGTASHHHMRVRELPSFVPGNQGATRMSGVFDELQTQLEPGNPRVQLLALSDGAVTDQAQTAAAAASAASTLKAIYQIEARAVRLFTSGQPDTRALASVLQLNTDTSAALVDLPNNTPLDEMARQMADMFGDINNQTFVLTTDEPPVIQLQPWAEPRCEISLKLGKNTIWLAQLPEQVRLNGDPVELREENALTQDTLGHILDDRLEFFMSQLKVLKVIETEQAKEQISRIVDYFKDLEASLKPAEELAPLLEGGGLKNRAVYMRKTWQRRVRSVTTLMESIANDDKVRVLNQAQQADYLRQMGTSTNSRALAKRAVKSGMDFDVTLRKEILQMKAHLDDLNDIDGRPHSVSFYSQASTLDGIREVCEMTDDQEVFEGLSAVDLLRLFNVVGVPAVGPIADFPDPMTYRLDNLMAAGSHVSVADLSTVELAGSHLRTPGTGVKIVNAIPVFDDMRIQRFLQRHAPSALEYLCSIGMRRVLAEVPQTFPYTLCGGVWRLIQQIDIDKSELNVMLLRRMLPSFHESLQGRFEYLVATLMTDQDPERSYFLSHNGSTNLISPLWRLVELGKLEHLPRILRALYTFESFQAMRRLCRQKDAKFYIEQVDRLLGVDFGARGTPLPERFSRPDPVHTQKVEMNRDVFAELRNAVDHVRYVTIIVPLMLAIRSEEPVAAARLIPQICDETVAKALELEYPLEEFLMYNLVEGHLYQSKQSRVDKDTTRSLRPDLGTRREGESMCQEYLLQRYGEDYEFRLKQMAGEEKKELCDELVEKLLTTDSMTSFNGLLGEGLTRGEVSFKIAHFNSQGCLELHEALLDRDRAVTMRAEKLEVFYIGEDVQEKAVWNGGNTYRTSTEPLRKLLESIGEEDAWNRIQDRYRRKVSHVYRNTQCNRHGHSNEFPSYFAFGHEILFSYVGAVTPSAWAEYSKCHCSCCGVAAALADPEGLRISVERLAAKRAKRAACLHDQAKVNAAIDEKKARRTARNAAKKQKLAPPLRRGS
eukprot:CAMPEP_0117515606 /NCGR_PEP_ID=MMETSP0784-20121206/30667_1 /TAXON_ID=39447 /ORGANISM="" /LENGTH=1076 /DNA_ID=CAMNT_0005311429 /DNA_START=29 /DNA_END=3257 /DNA_ORIENTATION=-